jgi:transposase
MPDAARWSSDASSQSLQQRTGGTRWHAVLICDDAGWHAKSQEIVVPSNVTLVTLPAYSPELNPMELAFAKLKALLRARAIRTVDGLWNALGNLVSTASRQTNVQFFRHDGYFQSA